MIQVAMTLTKGQSHWSMSENWPKSKKMGHILNAMLIKDFILGTKVRPNKAHSTIQVTVILDKVTNVWKKLKNWPYLGCYFTHTSYFVPRYHPNKPHLGTLNTPDEHFITNLKMKKKLSFFWYMGHIISKNFEKSGGPCARLCLVEPTTPTPPPSLICPFS